MGIIGRVQTVLAGWDGSPGLQTSYYHLDAGWNWAGYHQNAVAGVGAAYTAAAAIFPSAMTMTVQPVVDIFEDTTGEMVDSYTGTQVIVSGTSGTDWGPIATGICVVWRTPGIVNNKRVRGRSFLVPMGSVAADVDGTPSATALDLAGDWATAMEGGLSPFGDLVVWSRPFDGSTKVPPKADRAGSSFIVSGHSIHDQFAVLRSRRD